MLAWVTKIIFNKLLPKILKFHSKGKPGCQIVLLKKDESRMFEEFILLRRFFLKSSTYNQKVVCRWFLN